MDPVWFLGAVCLAIAVTMLIILTWSQNCKCSQGFQDINNNLVLSMCPLKSATFTDASGNTMCCQGVVSGHNCDGTVLCSMSGKTDAYPSCPTYLNNLYAPKQMQFCTQELPNYYEGLSSGCTNGVLVGDRSSPADPRADFCTIFNSYLDETNPASCYNRKAKKGKCPNNFYEYSQSTGGMCCPTLPTNWNAVKKEYTGCASPNKCTVSFNVNNANPSIPICPGSSLLPSAPEIRQNNKIATIISTGNYVLTFKITPLGTINAWSNILHFTNMNTNSDISRMPAIWFVPGTTRLHVRMGDTNDWNWGIDQTIVLPMNQETIVKLTCKDKNVHLNLSGAVSSDTYMKQPKQRPVGPAIVYAGAPWYYAANARINSLSYINI